MAIETPCQTPEALFKTRISDNVLKVVVTLPFSIPDEHAELIEANVHNALELVLAPLFVGRNRHRSRRVRD